MANKKRSHHKRAVAAKFTTEQLEARVRVLKEQVRQKSSELFYTEAELQARRMRAK